MNIYYFRIIYRGVMIRHFRIFKKTSFTKNIAAMAKGDELWCWKKISARFV